MHDDLLPVVELMQGIAEDNSVPRNIRAAIAEAREKLENGDIDVGTTSAVYVLDDISNDINMPSHTRTEIWQLISELEAVREKHKAK